MVALSTLLLAFAVVEFSGRVVASSSLTLSDEEAETLLAHLTNPSEEGLVPWAERDRLLETIRRTFDAYYGISAAVHYLRLRDVQPPDDSRVRRASRPVRRTARFVGELALAPTSGSQEPLCVIRSLGSLRSHG